MILPGIKRKIIRTEHLPHNWEGPTVDMINMDSIPFNDRLRIVIDFELISDKLLRIFAVWCARRVLSFCPRKSLEDLLDKVQEYAMGDCSFSEVRELHQAALKLSLNSGTKSVQLEEAEAAVFSTVNVFAKDAAKEASFHSLVVLSYYNDREEIQKKHLWKIQDLILQYLTSGEVDFILRNDQSASPNKGEKLK